MSSSGEGHGEESQRSQHATVATDLVAAQALLELAQSLEQSDLPEANNDGSSHDQSNIQTTDGRAIEQDDQRRTMQPPSLDSPVIDQPVAADIDMLDNNEHHHDQAEASTSALATPRSWFHDLLKDRSLKLFLRYGLRCQELNGEGARRVQRVLESMPERCCFQEAVWYLEENEWDINRAISQYTNDEGQRAANGGDRWYQDALQRANSVAVATFSASDLVIKVRSVHGTTFDLQFPGSAHFDVNNTYQLAALNQWRADLGRLLGDVPDIPPSQQSQTSWHTCEERLFRNRFAAKKAQYEAGGPPEYQNIVDMLNAYFVGRYYPGQVGPYRPRNFASAASMIDRKWKRSADRQRESANQAKVAAAERIEATRAEEQQEYDAWVV